jgi:hypothetical protein
MDKIQLNTDVRECKWLEEEQVWEVKLQHLMTGVGDLSEHERSQKIQEHGREFVYVSEETIRAKVLISSVGGLVCIVTLMTRMMADNLVGRAKGLARRDSWQGQVPGPNIPLSEMGL